MWLMGMAIETLRGKGVVIDSEEEEAALVAILLHDIGHGPFSHSLEHSIVEGVSHEYLSGRIMDDLNKEFGGRLSLAIAIFRNQYPKFFLHQLVSSQLDTDRMDYLIRDSFYTGVTEGVISFNRIIDMLNVFNDELVVEEKGIYSIEKFLIARRLMYWQVYLHKTVISAEQMLVNILRRAKALYGSGKTLFASPSLEHFLRNRVTEQNFREDVSHLAHFTRLDDTDIWSAIKVWATDSDPILRMLCARLIARKLYHIELYRLEPDQQQIDLLKELAVSHYRVDPALVDYYIWTNSIENSAYEPTEGSIKIYMKDGSLQDILDASDLSNLAALSRKVKKFAVSFPKEMMGNGLPA